MSEHIEIRFDEYSYLCESVIVVPEKGIEEHGYIQVMTVKDSAHAKHEYHAMAQVAYFQYQDDELEIKEVDPPVNICSRGEDTVAEDGMILYRDAEGRFHTLALGQPNRKKTLEAAYRYCTRWVRLDI